MVFSSITDLRDRFPKVKIVGGIDGLQQDASIKNVTMIEHTKTDELPEHIPTPNDELLDKIFRNLNTVIVRTRDGTIPSVPGYITFPVYVGNDNEQINSKFAALVRKDEYKKDCTPTPSPSQSPVITFRKSPANSIATSVSMASADNKPCIHNIDGIDKAKLLLELYGWANCQGPENAHIGSVALAMALLTCAQQKGNLSLAKKCIKNHQTSFDTIDLGGGDRLLAVDISTAEVDFTKYEAQHGTGKAAEIISELRNKPKAQKCVIS